MHFYSDIILKYLKSIFFLSVWLSLCKAIKLVYFMKTELQIKILYIVQFKD